MSPSIKALPGLEWQCGDLHLFGKGASHRSSDINAQGRGAACC